ncbi:MAG: TlpA disulfide reductase family protein [Myxococcales bacterium]
MSALLLAATLAAAPPELQRLATADELGAALESGRPLLVHVWALWCALCVEELPRQLALAKAALARGASVLFVSADGFEKEAEVRERLATLGSPEGVRHALLSEDLDPAEVTRRIDRRWQGTLPATFLLKPGGGVAVKVLGPIDEAETRRVLGWLARPPAKAPAKR